MRAIRVRGFVVRTCMATAVTGLVVVGAHPGIAAERARRAGVMHHVTAAAGPSILFEWDPAELSIAAGDKVMWMNPTSAPHRVVPYEGPWDTEMDLPAGEGKATFRFKKPGVYRYRCDIPTHSVLAGAECIGMCGTITVE